MSEFLHTLADELRVREKYLEDHADRSAFTDLDAERRAGYDRLMHDLKSFMDQVETARRSGNDYAKHFERELKDRAHQLKVRIDSWSKTLD